MYKVTLIVLTTIAIASPSSAQQSSIPFAVCVQSDTWTRPSTDAQSKIWNDNRYKDVGATSYEWTHNFVWNEPDSASLAYHSQNLSGLWTDIRENQCPRRDEERGAWSELWALNYRVTRINLQGLVFTVTVESRTGYEIIQFRLPSSSGFSQATVRIVTEQAEILDEWKETSPGVFTPVPQGR